MTVMRNGNIYFPRRGHKYPTNPNEEHYVRDPLDTYHFVLQTPEMKRLKKIEDEKKLEYGLKELPEMS